MASEIFGTISLNKIITSGTTIDLPQFTVGGSTVALPTPLTPTVALGTVTSGSATAAPNTTVPTTPGVRCNLINGWYTTQFKVTLTPAATGFQTVTIPVVNRTTKFTGITDIFASGVGLSAASTYTNADVINNITVQTVPNSTNVLLQFNANNTTAAHTIDMSLSYTA